jgi:hypothetical protein
MTTSKDPRSLAVPGNAWITDSRAYNLIWLGRWLERAGGIANAVDAIAGASADEAEFDRQAESLAAAWGLEGPPVPDLRNTFAGCLSAARDDASQVGPLELLRKLNALLDEIPALWPETSRGGCLAAIAALQPRLDDVTSEIEARWFRRLGG